MCFMVYCFTSCGPPACVCRCILFFSYCNIYASTSGDVTLDYPDVTSLAHDVYFHIGHEPHDSMYCFHHMILLHYDISCAFNIGT